MQEKAASHGLRMQMLERARQAAKRGQFQDDSRSNSIESFNRAYERHAVGAPHTDRGPARTQIAAVVAQAGSQLDGQRGSSFLNIQDRNGRALACVVNSLARPRPG